MSFTFPDNDKRDRRQGELVGDINTDIAACVQYSTDIDSKIKELSAASQKLLESLKLPDPGKVTTVEIHKQTFEIAQLVSSAFVAKYAYKGLAEVAAQLLLRRTAQVVQAGEGAPVELGDVGGEALEPEVAAAAEELSISTATKVVCGVGGLVIAAGVGVAVDAIDGAIVRDKLQKKIHELVPLRSQTRLNQMKMRTLKEDVAALIDSFDTLRQAGIPVTQDQIDAVVNTNTAKFENELQAVTGSSADTELSSLDRARGSWTNEDR